MASIQELQREIEKIKERNKKVELDKKWETSYSRRILLSIFTYLAVGFYLSAIGIKDAWVNAIIPALAFMLSTMTLPFFKKLWLRFNKK